MRKNFLTTLGYTERNYSNFFGAYAKVYTLSDKDGDVFYVGCTVHELEKRVAAHISEARSGKGNKRKAARIVQADLEVYATIVEIKWVTERSAVDALMKMASIEKKWISKYMDLGYNLCNKEAHRGKNSKRQPLEEYVGMTIKVTSAIKEAKIGNDINTVIVEEVTTKSLPKKATT